jgi:hypothetical protein
VFEIHLVCEAFYGIEYHVKAINAGDYDITARSLQRLPKCISVYPLPAIRLDAETSYVLDACPLT